MRKWRDLPVKMQIQEVRPYYEALRKKRVSLVLKRVFDIAVSALMLIIFIPVFAIIAIAIKLDSPGPIFFRQIRITSYGRKFRIHKFRTMCSNAEQMGTQVTVGNDARITRVGKLIRKCRLDEIPQLIDVLVGDMTFVGVRPEVEKYVRQYKPEWLATLLLPAGITNLTSILYKDEDNLLKDTENADRIYVKEILPEKMKWNLQGIKEFSVKGDFVVLCKTLMAMLKND